MNADSKWLGEAIATSDVDRVTANMAAAGDRARSRTETASLSDGQARGPSQQRGS